MANTAYSIGLPADLADVHGQRLGDTEPVQVEVGDARPALQPFANLLTTLDPFASSATLPVVSIGHRTLRVRTYAIDDGDWAGFPEQVSSAVYARPDNATRPGELPYELIDDRTVDVDGDVNAVSTTELDLDDVLANHDGRVVVRVDVDGSSSANDFELRTAITWVQRTTIGVDVAADARTLHAFVTDLRSGAAIGSATIDALGANGRVVASATTAGDGTATIDLTTTPIELLRVTAGRQRGARPARRLRRRLAARRRRGSDRVVRVHRPGRLPARRDGVGQGLDATDHHQRRRPGGAARCRAGAVRRRATVQATRSPTAPPRSTRSAAST